MARVRLVDFGRIPGASILWPQGTLQAGERVPGACVVVLQSPLSFLHAYDFKKALQALAQSGDRVPIIEANGTVEIDDTGARILGDAIKRLRTAGVDVALARLESPRARQSFVRHGLEALIGRDDRFHSVEEAVEPLRPPARP